MIAEKLYLPDLDLSHCLTLSSPVEILAASGSVSRQLRSEGVIVPAVRATEVEPWRRRLYLPAYSVSEAAWYARTSRQTVAYWHYGAHERTAALPGKAPGEALSYLQLVEVAFVAAFRKAGVPLAQIRNARVYLAKMFQEEFPFARRKFYAEGRDILLQLQEFEPKAALGQLVVANRSGQMAWQDVIAERFQEFEYEDDLALRWHPAGAASPIVIDLRVAFGAPEVHGVATWVLRGRWEAGETVEEIREDFDLQEDVIRQALQFEGVEIAP